MDIFTLCPLSCADDLHIPRQTKARQHRKQLFSKCPLHTMQAHWGVCICKQHSTPQAEFTHDAVTGILLHCKMSVTTRTHGKQRFSVCSIHTTMLHAAIKCTHAAFYRSTLYRTSWHCIAAQL